MYAMLNKIMEEIMWQGWIDIAVGIWLFLSGLISAIRTPASMIAAGAAVIFLVSGVPVHKKAGRV